MVLFAPNFFGGGSSTTVVVDASSIGKAGSLQRLVRGADYKAINDRALLFSFPHIDNIADPAVAVCRFIVTKRDDVTENLATVGVLSLFDAETDIATFEIDGADTVTMALADYEYRVEVVDDSGNVVVPIFSDRQRLLRLIDN